MKYYDVVISLGQFCITTTALRKCHLQAQTMVFDWSAGIKWEKAGHGGLAGKINLICDDFKNFFNYEDFEDLCRDTLADKNHTWVVNNRTGLQYQHDFPINVPLKDSFEVVKERYLRRAKRLLEVVNSSERVLFVYIALDTGFNDNYLIEQQEKLAKKFSNTTIDFLYIMHNEKYDIHGYDTYQLNSNVCKIECNVRAFTVADGESFEHEFYGNTVLYYPLLRDYCYTPVTINYLRETIYNMDKKITELIKTNSLLVEKFIQKPAERRRKNKEIIQKIFSVTNAPDKKHKVWCILGVKMKFKRKAQTCTGVERERERERERE